MDGKRALVARMIALAVALSAGWWLFHRPAGLRSVSVAIEQIDRQPEFIPRKVQAAPSIKPAGYWYDGV
ncbi:MAG TPA: hypothetical protein VL486_05795 [Verrucomicrobiae bacterium]|nr:hypothetical protein [Verrucomicrobiae bacterium]